MYVMSEAILLYHLYNNVYGTRAPIQYKDDILPL